MSDKREDKIGGHSFRRDQQLDISIMEAKPKEKSREDDSREDDPFGWKDKYKSWWDDPEWIGTLLTGFGSSMEVVLHLQPDAFDLFWSAAEATHGSTRNMQFVLKPDSPTTLTVTNVGLFESMSAPQADDPSGRLHPVVAELRVMREKAKSIVVGFAVVLIAWILLSIFRHF